MTGLQLLQVFDWEAQAGSLADQVKAWDEIPASASGKNSLFNPKTGKASADNPSQAELDAAVEFIGGNESAEKIEWGNVDITAVVRDHHGEAFLVAYKEDNNSCHMLSLGDFGDQAAVDAFAGGVNG